MGALLMAADKTAYLTGRCRIYETLYLSDYAPGDKGDASLAVTQANHQLTAALTYLYTAILRLLATAIHIYTNRPPGAPLAPSSIRIR